MLGGLTELIGRVKGGSGMDMEPMAQLLMNLGVAAVLGWYLFYDTTVAKPRAENNMLARMDQITDRQAASTERIATTFSVAIKEERQSCDIRIAILQDEIRHLRGLSDTKRGEIG